MMSRYRVCLHVKVLPYVKLSDKEILEYLIEIKDGFSYVTYLNRDLDLLIENMIDTRFPYLDWRELNALKEKAGLLVEKKTNLTYDNDSEGTTEFFHTRHLDCCSTQG